MLMPRGADELPIIPDLPIRSGPRMRPPSCDLPPSPRGSRASDERDETAGLTRLQMNMAQNKKKQII
jgi:hypothetical protein